MAQERRRWSGELAAWHLAGIVAFMPFVNKQLNPASINPYGTARESPALARVKAAMAQIEWRVRTEGLRVD